MSSQKLLLPLTSLRFFAAAMVVTGHCLNDFGAIFPEIGKITAPYLLQLYQGVSFFFVLSGFILAYAYPHFAVSPFKEVNKFLLARFARIWPAHIFTLIVFLFVVTIPLTLHVIYKGIILFLILISLLFILKILQLAIKKMQIFNFIQKFNFENLLRHPTFLIVIFSLLIFLICIYLNRRFINGLIMWCNISMIQAWIPFPEYYFSFNAPSWSISTEFFFYLCFPFLMYKIKQRWFLKLGIALALLFISLFICHLTYYPFTNVAVDQHALMYISPISRLFEFVLGMVMWLVYEKIKQKKFNFFAVTAAEILILSIDILSIHYGGKIAELVQTYLGVAAGEWIRYSGSCFFFASTIVILALQQGMIARILSGKNYVLLGEISYSVYLIHVSLLIFITKHYSSWFAAYNFFALFSLFWLLCLLSSYMIWRFVERPSRSFIVSLTLNKPRNMLKTIQV